MTVIHHLNNYIFIFGGELGYHIRAAVAHRSVNSFIVPVELPQRSVFADRCFRNFLRRNLIFALILKFLSVGNNTDIRQVFLYTLGNFRKRLPFVRLQFFRIKLR